MRPLGKIAASLGIVVGIIMVSAPTQARGIVAAHGATRVSAAGPAPGDVAPPGSVPLESLPISYNGSASGASSNSSKIVPGGASVTYHNYELPHGILVGYGGITVPLNRRYSRLVGTMYPDINEGAGDPGLGIVVADVNADMATTIYSMPVFSSESTRNPNYFHFDVNIEGIKSLEVDYPSTIGHEFLVAYLVPDFPAPSTSTPKAAARLLPGTVPFRWNAVPGASAYYLQFWEVATAKGTVLTPKTFSATVTGTSYALNAASYPRGVYHWRMASVGKAEISSWGPERILTLR